MAHSVCWVVFVSGTEIKFQKGDTFMYASHEWEAVTFRRMVASGFVYSVLGYPKEVCSMVEGSYTSLRGLASALKIKFADGAEDLPFEFPLKGLLGPVLHKLRYESLEQNRDSLGKAYFLFYDSRGLYGKTYSSLGEVSPKLDPGVLAGALNFSSVTDSMLVQYGQDHAPKWKAYKNWVRELFGRKVECKGVIPALVGNCYLLPSGEQDLDSLDKMVVVRQRFDSRKSPQPWTLTFGHLEV
jgi:hypothetical protein